MDALDTEQESARATDESSSDAGSSSHDNPEQHEPEGPRT